MHTHIKQMISQELSLLRNSLAKVEEEIQTCPKTDKDEDLLLQRDLSLEKERLTLKIQKAQDRLENVEKEVVLGPIKVEIDKGPIRNFYIVAEELINPKLGLISKSSPLANELATRQPGDSFEMNTPSGAVTATIHA